MENLSYYIDRPFYTGVEKTGRKSTGCSNPEIFHLYPDVRGFSILNHNPERVLMRLRERLVSVNRHKQRVPSLAERRIINRLPGRMGCNHVIPDVMVFSILTPESNFCNRAKLCEYGDFIL